MDVIASRYLEQYATGAIDRLDVVYMKFGSIARQEVVTETMLPIASLANASDESGKRDSSSKGRTADIGGAEDRQAEIASDRGTRTQYEFLPSPASILEEIVPMSFKVKLFKCFLDSAVSEQVARMVAMKSATESADDLIKSLSMQYNRARQGRITSELVDLLGGVEALK